MKVASLRSKGIALTVLAVVVLLLVREPTARPFAFAALGLGVVAIFAEKKSALLALSYVATTTVTVIAATYDPASQVLATAALVLVLGALLVLHSDELTPRWKHIEDLDRPGDIYLSRLFLVKRQWIGVYLHIIRRDDWSRCQHDHPWAFITCILAGGYEEEVGGRVFVRRPGYVGYRGRNFEHRITKLTTGKATTLVIRFNDHVEWNFRTVYGKMNWRKYLALPGATRVAWCDDFVPGRER